METFTEFEGSPECEFIPKSLPKTVDSTESDKKNCSLLKVKTGPQRKPPGFQAQLVCVPSWACGSVQITALTINSNYGLMAYGNEYGLTIVDIVKKTCVLNLCTQEMYGAQDPYSRTPRSPKRLENSQSKDDSLRSPSIDQINGLVGGGSGGGGGGSGSGGGGGGSGAGGGIGSGTTSSSATTPNAVNSNMPLSMYERGMSISSAGSPSKRTGAGSGSTTITDPSMALPTAWLGTSLGSILTISLSIPENDLRKANVVQTAPTGAMFRLKGSILSMSLLDCNGALIPYSFESWREDSKDSKEKRERTPTKTSSTKMSPTNPDGLCDRQFIAIASEKQAGVFALPSQNCVYRKKLVDFDFIVKAEIISMKDSVCLICYASNGHLMVFTLPSLKPLLEVDFLPLADLSHQYNNMLGDLYVPHEMPEAPKESFFKGLFGGGMRNLDREELFGESSGKANRSVAKHIPGPNADIQALNARTTSVTSEIGKAHQLMLERGDKLSQLEERTERMANEAQQFSSSAHLLMNKYKDKKWYQL
uniref:V-SNARE coiled-coil homology domain-containing protein n=1 Tax=Anopheles melas TaxID=34690 RepID=A0A182TVS3_9DIPT